jgi:hypothetical protein
MGQATQSGKGQPLSTFVFIFQPRIACWYAWKTASKDSLLLGKAGDSMRPQSVTRPRHLAHLADDPRGYPIVATVGRDVDGPDFGSINELRKLALATFDWCSVCGLPFNGADRWQMAPGDDWKGRARDVGLVFNEAPAHEICLVYAAHVCPHLSSPGHRMGDEYRAGQRRESRINLLGFRRTSQVRTAESALQPDIYILGFEQADPTDEISYFHPEELSERYSSLLAAEKVPTLSAAESGLVEFFNDQADEHPVTGAAVMAGAAFLQDAFKVQGMDFFAERPNYRSLAVQLLDLRKLADFGSELEVPACRLMSQWLLERQDSLPEALAAWRRAGDAVARAHGLTPSRSRPQGSGRTVPKNAPCPCGSGRKAGRCHPGGLAEPVR